ncbi:CST complex subunit STN1 isoform X2 [Callorhinchus milii]|uniref:CST complex subunit STN1 isoform X2 n=1 Tax=Callorhinchus milii TaxID=7868 RepID=UPI001C3F6D22|nr:CST complex subunit STN1 isoform X2 [Callorhinchus milii]
MMETACEGGADTLPPELWGLDPVFAAFAKLYIRDILALREAPEIPGVFFYRSRPISKVDVLGIVVQKQEKERFYRYGVDDGTGVITCVCWKQGQVLAATEPDRVADTRCAAQISRMLELPQLYRTFYDKPFQIPPPSGAASGAKPSGAGLLLQEIKLFLKRSRVTNFHQHELEAITSLVALAHKHLLSQPSAQDPSGTQQGCSGAASRQIHTMFQEAIGLLQEEGVVFPKTASPDTLYLVTDEDQQLHSLTLEIIREDSGRPKGCPLLRVLRAVQSRHRVVSESALLRVLNTLECNSDIISTTDSHYIAV